ncbi:adenosine deaminase AGSA [Biomphalaria glabrata]|nr:adenosine deaminase AGSA [Biomphalaria glabrata]
MVTLFLCLSVLLTLSAAVPTWYLEARQTFIDAEASMRIGAQLTLNPKEQLVNKYMMSLKNSSIQESIWTTKPFSPSISFFESKAWIDNSTLYDVIKMMPKGGILHLHDKAMTSLNWTVKTLTYLPGLYTKLDTDQYSTRLYKFANSSPGADWTLISDLRNASQDPDNFDEMLAVNMSIWTPEPFKTYPSVNDVWGKFRSYFRTINGLINNITNVKAYVEEAIQEFYDDNVQYMELRGGTMIDNNGNDVTEQYLEIIQNAAYNFQSAHPDFYGVKVIIPGSREDSEEGQAKMVNKTLSLMSKFPDLVKGFDLVDQEDINHLTLYYIDEFLKNDQSILPYFFHAGETDWTQGVDMNLVDSVLLNASRIGHGFAVYHHPKVLEAVVAKGIAVELNPISNQVLGLVSDLRNHPGAFLFANGAPVVVSSDDPAAWFASPLSHDFYMAFMGLGSINDDLRVLKQLAMNSFKYSTMTSDEKNEALQKWQIMWDKFIDDVIKKYHL